MKLELSPDLGHSQDWGSAWSWSSVQGHSSVQGQDHSLASGLSAVSRFSWGQGSVLQPITSCSISPTWLPSTSLPKAGRPLAALQQKVAPSPIQCPPDCPQGLRRTGRHAPTRCGPAPTSSFICTSSRAVATRSRCLLADSTWLQ